MIYELQILMLYFICDLPFITQMVVVHLLWSVCFVCLSVYLPIWMTTFSVQEWKYISWNLLLRRVLNVGERVIFRVGIILSKSNFVSLNNITDFCQNFPSKLEFYRGGRGRVLEGETCLYRGNTLWNQLSQTCWSNNIVSLNQVMDTGILCS